MKQNKMILLCVGLFDCCLALFVSIIVRHFTGISCIKGILVGFGFVIRCDLILLFVHFIYNIIISNLIKDKLESEED